MGHVVAELGIDHVQMYCDWVDTTSTIGKGQKKNKRQHRWGSVLKYMTWIYGSRLILIGLTTCDFFSSVATHGIFASKD